jgi:uncharacterized damage-inducible protein DinB
MNTTAKPAMLPVNALIAANLAVLEQGAQLLSRLDDRVYTRVAAPLFDYSVASHVRHCLDSYTSFLQGVERGMIDYDQRARDARIERDRHHAQSRIAATIMALQELKPDLSATTLQARQDSRHWAVTSLERELQFLLSHTVHHYALAALILRTQGIEPGREFGVAPSTLEYWRQIEMYGSEM